MRRSLYLKDDDYRLSFLYGNFTTLTRFTEADLERVVTERLSPLYVSIHATDPDVRTRLLRNRRGATSLRWLALLLDAGIEVHGQVVVCPGINDGAVLDDTLLGVLDRFPKLATLGVVPLGVSAHNREPEMRPHTRGEAAAVVDTIERVAGALPRRARPSARVRVRRVLPPRRARRSPRSTRTTAVAQHENGIGMARTFEAEVRAALAGDDVRGTGVRSGFFAVGRRRARRRLPRPAHDPNDAAARSTTAHAAATRRSRSSPASSAPACSRRSSRARRARRATCACCPVANQFFGGNIGVTGLLTGADVARRARRRSPTATATCSPTSRSRAAASSTARRSPSCRARSRSSPTDGASLVAALRVATPSMTSASCRVVAIVGRPNVGKSTLVNRIVGRRDAIVEEQRPASRATARSFVAEWNGRAFALVDTGGWLAPGEAGLTGEEPALAAKVSAQAEAAISAPTSSCSSSTSPSASPRRTPASRGCCSAATSR